MGLGFGASVIPALAGSRMMERRDATAATTTGWSWIGVNRVNVCMSPGKLVPGAPGSSLLNSRGYFVRVKCVTAHAQSIKSRGFAAHASAIKRGVMSSTLRTLRRRMAKYSLSNDDGRSTSRRRWRRKRLCGRVCYHWARSSRGKLDVPKISPRSSALRNSFLTSVKGPISFTNSATFLYQSSAFLYQSRVFYIGKCRERHLM